MKRLNLKKKKMFESVYVCRSTVGDSIVIVPAKIGIVKLEGCVQFFCAIKDKYGDYGAIYEESKEAYISVQECRTRYSSFPPRNTAWLVEEGRKYINWTRVDHTMHLLDRKGNIVKE